MKQNGFSRNFSMSVLINQEYFVCVCVCARARVCMYARARPSIQHCAGNMLISGSVVGHLNFTYQRAKEEGKIKSISNYLVTNRKWKVVCMCVCMCVIK
jgi:hypothetical protein